MLILAPFDFLSWQAGSFLCCVGCAIFGITEVPTDGVAFDASDFAYTNAEEGTGPPQSTSVHATASEPIAPTICIPQPPEPLVSADLPVSPVVLTGPTTLQEIDLLDDGKAEKTQAPAMNGELEDLD
jgi:hypothetical protein